MSLFRTLFPTFRISNDPVQAGQIRTRRNLVAGDITARAPRHYGSS